MSIPAKTTVPTTFLTNAGTVDFEFSYQPGSFLKDNHSIFLIFKVANTDGSNPVTPIFVENFLDNRYAVEWLWNNKPFAALVPSFQVVMEPALELSDSEYEALCVGLNHGKTLAFGGVTAIAASGTKTYMLRVPNPFPKSGFWLGSMRGSNLTMRIKSQNAVSAGTGTLVLNELTLYLDTITIPPEDYKELEQQWYNKCWLTTEVIVHENNAITLVASGQSPTVKLEAFKDQEVSHIITILHASRSFTGNAYWSLQTLSNDASVHIISKNGSQLFTSNSELYAFNRYIRGTRQYGDSKVFQNLPLILHNTTPDIQARIHLEDHDLGKFIFTVFFIQFSANS